MSALRKVLKINGVERSFICDTNDSLAEAIRNLGLTGTKIGCGAGQCGACNVILNGKLTRICTRKVTKVPDYSEIVTIEGIGTAEHLHPIQAAWIKYGGVQCGFCSPGFIMSAKALLDENPNVTRDDIRAWFTKNRNACRCTGYKPLIDATEAAAKVMRGEWTMEDLEWKAPEDGSVFNTDMPKPSALGKVLGVTDYGGDIALKVPGMLHVAVVWGGVARANILGIDTSEAEKLPGVVKVVTGKDVPGANNMMMPTGTFWSKCKGDDKPVIMTDKIFRRGDPVALVIAESPRIAREAAALVKLDLEVLEGYEYGLDAIAPDAEEIHPGIPNMYCQIPLIKGPDTRPIFAKAPHIAEFSVATIKQAHVPIEPDCCNAFIDEDGVVTCMYKSHYIYGAKMGTGFSLGIPMDKMRVIFNPSGGAFGYSVSPQMPALAAVATMAVDGRPVSIVLNYKEHMLFTGKREPIWANVRLACDDEGHILAAENDLIADKGAYSEITGGLKPCLKYYLNMYNVPSARMVGAWTYSDTPFSTAYRCPGSKAINTASEQIMDIMAEQLGMDPIDFRLVNIWREDHCDPVWIDKPSIFPLENILETARPRLEAFKKHAAENSTDEVKYGAGLSLGGFKVAQWNDKAAVKLELAEDGTIKVYNTWEDLGQGADIGTLAMVHQALKVNGMEVPVEKIHLEINDTGTCPDTGVSGASRQNVMNEFAFDACAKLMIEAMKKEDGTFRTYEEMVADGLETSYQYEHSYGPSPHFNDYTTQGSDSPFLTFACFLAEVAVEVATGKVKLVELHNIADCGVTTNRLSLEGQGYSGLMHGAGYALSEELRDYDKDVNLIPYGFPFCDMMPDAEHYTLTNLATPRSYMPFGASGCSEGFESGAQSAIMNAIYNAVGIRIRDLPATPDKVKAAIDAKAAGTYQPPEKFDFHYDFYERLDELIAQIPDEVKETLDLEH